MIAALTLALALAADAFAVALAQGCANRPSLADALRIALAFGAAQALMPVFGYGLGAAGGAWFAAADHWVAFALLGLLGGRMIRAGLAGGESGTIPLGGSALLLASVATSIDAGAAGLTFSALGLALLPTVATIGVVTLALSFVGARMGARIGRRAGGAAEIGGGVVLVLLGVKVLAEHMG